MCFQDCKYFLSKSLPPAVVKDTNKNDRKEDSVSQMKIHGQVN